MKYFVILSFVALGILSVMVLSVPITAIAQEVEPPLKQIKNTHPTNVICKDDLVLRFKYDNKPVCMDIFTIVKIEKRNPEYFTLFNMGEFPLIGSWNPNLENRLTFDSDTLYSNDQPRPAVGTILWNDETAEHEIKYLMINGSDLTMYGASLLQDPSDRHNWPINVSYRGDENTILIFELPDGLELQNAVGMHMEQFERQNILFPFVESENKTNQQIIFSDLSPEENGFVFVELVFLESNHNYDITEIPMSAAKKYLSENSVDLDNIPKVYCNMKDGQYKDNQCLFEESSSNYVCDAWDFYITSQCKP